MEYEIINGHMISCNSLGLHEEDSLNLAEYELSQEKDSFIEKKFQLVKKND